MSRKRAFTAFLSPKFMITRSSIAFEDFLGSSVVPQVMPPWCALCAGRCGDDFGQLSECISRQASANYKKSFALLKTTIQLTNTHKMLNEMKRLKEILIQYLCDEYFQFGLDHRSL